MPNKSIKIIDIQGHRGCRGLYPENTLIAFEHAINLGVSTLELDVVINKYGEFIVSHEPFFSHLISTGPNGEPIIEAEELKHNIYQMDYEEIKSYDVGLKKHPNYPEQTNLAAYKPSLTELVRNLEEKFAFNIQYNIELKRKPEWDGEFTAPLDHFVSTFIDTIESLDIEDHISVQSFDIECLKLLKQSSLQSPLVYLIENELSPQENLERLGFTPDIYSPDYKLVDPSLINFCKSIGMKIIPWTVNEERDMQRLIDQDVDGIITDYPNRLITLIKRLDYAEIKS